MGAASSGLSDRVQKESAPEPPSVTIDYVNWRGERSLRRIVPGRLYVADLEWHPGTQWILDAWDLDKEAIRSFSMVGIKRWLAPTEATAPIRSV